MMTIILLIFMLNIQAKKLFLISREMQLKAAFPQ